MKRKVFAVVLMVAIIQLLLVSSAFAARGKKGNTEGFFNSCCLGPRIGIEMNEGQTVTTMEYLQYLNYVPYVGVVGIVPRLILAVEAGQKNGVGGFFAGCCIGPRVGKELDQTKIRVTEWIRLIPIVGIIPGIIHGVEAYNGTTMKEIEKKEGLKKGRKKRK